MGLGDRLLEGIEVHDHQVDQLDSVLLGLGQVQPLGGPAWVSLAQARTVGMTVTLPF